MNLPTLMDTQDSSGRPVFSKSTTVETRYMYKV